MRFIKELINPSLKCERVGHNNLFKGITIRKASNEPWASCEDYRAKVKICKRCGQTTEPFDLIYLTCYSKVTMPTSMWNRMKEKGYIKVDS